MRNIVEVVKSFLREVSKKYKVEEAYLFGSYVKGTWLKTSDVDLVVVSRDFESVPFLERLDELNYIQWKMGIKPFIEVIPLTPSELEEKLKYSTVLRDASKYWVKVWNGTEGSLS